MADAKTERGLTRARRPVDERPTEAALEDRVDIVPNATAEPADFSPMARLLVHLAKLRRGEQSGADDDAAIEVDGGVRD